LLYHLYNYYT